jgi:hypothetical protein
MAFWPDHIRNAGESWLASQFTLEYAVLFDFINPSVCALDLPIALGGSSNYFRVRAHRRRRIGRMGLFFQQF